MKPRNRSSMPIEAIRFALSQGYRVYMRDLSDSWFVYGGAEGDVAYVQFDPMYGYSASTKHYPNRESGSGYQITRGAAELTAQALADALRITVPSWHRRDTPPRKYRDMAEYKAANSFNAEYREVLASDLEGGAQ